ncbi:threonine aldolase family protein [Flexivirga caeni]|uniref:Low specificity L-threonine aldolase n=1 Tax=Flexivirga caeni TaxID=2294115 RepID=A0A3M9MEC7_9MICO|nr:low specificity L-threonine aldolase [Flexivirga caeni]RNI23844.1 low specificity L-threonine aldolase [Flexivirga caeni]
MSDSQTFPAPLHDPAARGFASDNYSGVHPEVLAAIVRANGGHQVSYGEDDYTAHLQDIFAEHFGLGVQAFPVFNGTGANVVALQSVTERWESVVCTTTAHIHVDECAAPERMGGLKLMTVATPDGKLTPELIDTVPLRRGDEHHAQPRVVSITQTTELGTAYTVAEIRAIAEHVHERDMVLHVDGSRLSNAAASLGVSFREMVTDTGVDIVSFGGTKNGLMVGEAVLVLNPDVVSGMKYLRKQSMQLASKMRFISAQLIALLTGDLYLRNAGHANAMAQRLADGVRDLPGLTIPLPVQANGVFPILPREVSLRLMEQFRFYFWDEAAGQVRWMCSFDTTESDVDAFIAAVRAELN